MFSTGKPSAPAARIPTVLTLVTVTLTVLVGIPTAAVGGSDALSMMLVGAGLSLLTVLGGYGCARLAFRGPDQYAVKLVVGGFVIRLVLLLAAVVALVSATGLDPGRFVLWVVTFYFALVMAEAWILARREMQEGASR
jgi:hypothetical protein